MLRNKLFIALSQIIAAATIGSSIQVYAQEQSTTSNFALEEVMVTARKKNRKSATGARHSSGAIRRYS